MFRLQSFLGVFVACAALVIVPISTAGGSAARVRKDGDLASEKRTLIWSDEFNGPDGSPPDPAKWSIVQGGSGFGNGELEYYTDHSVNLHQDKGNLVITARKGNYAGPDGALHEYTSARIETRGLFQQQYGRIEARIKLPKGQGIWPAFWMMGGDFASIGWPACGEIDIMENVGFEPSTVHGSLHGPGYSGGEPLTGSYTLPGGARFSDDFHLFAVEWKPREIRFFVDDSLYETKTADNVPPGKPWVFDHPFYILFNLAVGGYWPGSPDHSTSFPQIMLVDYVRVYRFNADEAAGRN